MMGERGKVMGGDEEDDGERGKVMGGDEEDDGGEGEGDGRG